DDFSIQMSQENSTANATSISASIEPLILRLSLRDILMALQILTKASELSNSQAEPQTAASDERARQLRRSGYEQRTPSGESKSKARSTMQGTVSSTRRSSMQKDETKRAARPEDLTATVEVIRVIPIGDVHELPILDLRINSYSATAADWSSNL